MILKYIFFIFHIFGILLSFICLFWYKEILLLNLLTIISWKLNENRCILTQLENYLFDESIIDIYFKFLNKKRKESNFIVPVYQRRLLYCSFIFGIFYHLYKNYLTIASPSFLRIP